MGLFRVGDVDDTVVATVSLENDGAGVAIMVDGEAVAAFDETGRLVLYQLESAPSRCLAVNEYGFVVVEADGEILVSADAVLERAEEKVRYAQAEQDGIDTWAQMISELEEEDR